MIKPQRTRPPYRNLSNKNHGFTLIEVMLVIVLIGMMVSVVQFSFSSSKPEQLLQQQSIRFAGVFDVAAEYGMLNNIELALFIEENTYQFLGFDGVRWASIADTPLFDVYTLPEGIEIALELDDLPIEDALLFDATSLTNEEEDEFGEAKKKQLTPQVYLLSGGDITSFRLSFYLAEFAFDDDDISYQVSGLYTTPLLVEGPLQNSERSTGNRR